MKAGKCAAVEEGGEEKIASMHRFSTIVAFEIDYNEQTKERKTTKKKIQRISSQII